MSGLRYNLLGDSDLRVSELALGTMTFGQQNTEAEAHAQLDRAFDYGVNFIDAAEMYPVPPRAETQGRTEEYIGTWLAKRSRDKVILATKAAGPRRPSLTYVRDGELAYTRANVRRAVENNLKRLRTDYIDLYQYHWPDRYVPQFGSTAYDPAAEVPSTPTEEQITAVADLIKEGKVRHWGTSNETPWGVVEFSRKAQQLGLPKPITIQNAYSLVNRHFEGGLAEATRHEKVSLLAYSSLAFGLLSGKHIGGVAQNTRFSLFDNFGARYRKPNVDEAVAAYVELARAHGLSPAHLALAFVRSRFFVGSTLLGATTLEQLEENLKSSEVTLSDDVLAAIDAIHARYPNPAP
jgi:aryl-alcohol dehydrogenase-like predicted oxidoreductase